MFWCVATVRLGLCLGSTLVQPGDACSASRRTLAAEVDPLMRPAFTMPEDALPPLQVEIMFRILRR